MRNLKIQSTIAALRCILASATVALTVSSPLILQGCNQEQRPQIPSVNNVSEKPLSLRSLTTGVKYEKAKFPKPITSLDNNVSFDYSFFGEDRLISVEFDAENFIYAYEILLKGNLEEMRRAIEEKISAENGKKTEFACEIEKASWGGADWEHKNCSIVSGTQRLLLEEKRPISRKPSSVDDLTWASMHMSRLLLEDIELRKKAKEKADEKARQKYEADKAKAKKAV